MKRITIYKFQEIFFKNIIDREREWQRNEGVVVFVRSGVKIVELFNKAAKILNKQKMERETTMI